MIRQIGYMLTWICSLLQIQGPRKDLPCWGTELKGLWHSFPPFSIECKESMRLRLRLIHKLTCIGFSMVTELFSVDQTVINTRYSSFTLPQWKKGKQYNIFFRYHWVGAFTSLPWSSPEPFMCLSLWPKRTRGEISMSWQHWRWDPQLSNNLSSSQPNDILNQYKKKNLLLRILMTKEKKKTTNKHKIKLSKIKWCSSMGLHGVTKGGGTNPKQTPPKTPPK